MHKLKLLIGRFKSLFENKYDYFYLLDFGSYSLKIALFEVHRQKKRGRILHVVEEPIRRPLRKKGAKETSNIILGVRNFEYMRDAAKKAFKKIDSMSRVKAKNCHLVIGLASEMVYGHTSSYLHKRENPDQAIDTSEIKHVIQNAELKAYEEVRKKFVEESGYSELDAHLIHPAIQEVKIDGHKVNSPLNMKGKEFYLSVFNAYLPKFYKDVFYSLASELKLDLGGLFYEPYMLFSGLSKKSPDDFEALIIDIGGKSTRVSLARKGKLENIKTFSFGGESFTRRIARELRVGLEEADRIKIRYSQNNVSKDAFLALERSLGRELSIFLNALELILKEFSQVNLLPGSIYVYGGGGNLPIIDDIIKKRGWKKNLSFLSPPKFHRVDGNIFRTRFVKSIPCDPKLVSLLALSDYMVDATNKKEDLLDRTLRRMTSLMQE